MRSTQRSTNTRSSAGRRRSKPTRPTLDDVKDVERAVVLLQEAYDLLDRAGARTAWRATEEALDKAAQAKAKAIRIWGSRRA